MKPHKHAELIKAWADGAVIQTTDCNGAWFDCNPHWEWDLEYRIKPEPKPDVVKYTSAYIDKFGQWDLRIHDDNLKLVWDGETGKLKSAEVLK